MPVGTKPWTIADPPSCAQNWTQPEKRRCVAAANETIANGRSEQDAIFACIAAAGRSTRKQDIFAPGTWTHPHGDHECYCPECGHSEMAGTNVKCSEQECPECGSVLRARRTGEQVNMMADSNKTILVQTSKILDYDRIKEAVWKSEMVPQEIELDILDVPGDHALVGGDGKVFMVPFSIVDDEVIFGMPEEGSMQFVPKTEMKANAPSWKCGAARDLPINQDRSWDGAAAKGRIFNWAGWPDNPKPASARRCFLAYDSANPELKGSYKLPFADIIDGSPVAIRSGLGNAASRLPQTDIPEGVMSTGRGVIEAYQARFEKKMAETKKITSVGGKTSLKIYRMKDGVYRWLAITGSAFIDREEEIVSRKAIDYSIAVSEMIHYRGFLNLYHVNKWRLGTCDFQMRVGNFLLEGGEWLDNAWANAVRKWVEGLDADAGREGAGYSVELYYDAPDLVDGVFKKAIIFNRALLKLKHAANPYTWLVSPGKQRRKDMSLEKDLVEVLDGDEQMAKDLLKDISSESKRLEELGVLNKGIVEAEAETPSPDAEVEPADKSGDEPGVEEKDKPEAGDKGDGGELAEDAPEDATEGEREIVFSEEALKALSKLVAKELNLDALSAKLETLLKLAEKLSADDDEKITAKLRRVPKSAISRDSESEGGKVKDKDIIGGEDPESEKGDVVKAREKHFEGFRS